MLGSDKQTGSLSSYVNLEERIPARHPLRKIKGVVDAALASLDAEFAALYAGEGRSSIAPERLLRASQRKRKLVEEPFGWGNTVGAIAKTDAARLEPRRRLTLDHGRLQSRQAAETAPGLRLRKAQGEAGSHVQPIRMPQPEASPL